MKKPNLKNKKTVFILYALCTVLIFGIMIFFIVDIFTGKEVPKTEPSQPEKEITETQPSNIDEQTEPTSDENTPSSELKLEPVNYEGAKYNISFDNNGVSRDGKLTFRISSSANYKLLLYCSASTGSVTTENQGVISEDRMDSFKVFLMDYFYDNSKIPADNALYWSLEDNSPDSTTVIEPKAVDNVTIRLRLHKYTKSDGTIFKDSLLINLEKLSNGEYHVKSIANNIINSSKLNSKLKKIAKKYLTAKKAKLENLQYYNLDKCYVEELPILEQTIYTTTSNTYKNGDRITCPYYAVTFNTTAVSLKPVTVLINKEDLSVYGITLYSYNYS